MRITRTATGWLMPFRVRLRDSDLTPAPSPKKERESVPLRHA
jgi:hypothetical protein